MRATASLSAVLLLLGTGCAGWRSRVDPVVARYSRLGTDSAPQSKKRLLLTLTARRPQLEQTPQEILTKGYRQRGLRVLEDSGYFAEVGSHLADPDLELVVNISEKTHYSRVMSVLCRLTMSLIPSPSRDEIEASGQVFSGSGEKLGELRVEAETTTIVELLLLPAIPSFFVTYSRARGDIFRGMIVQMRDMEELWK